MARINLKMIMVGAGLAASGYTLSAQPPVAAQSGSQELAAVRRPAPVNPTLPPRTAPPPPVSLC
jgi:hypothetical protein